MTKPASTACAKTGTRSPIGSSPRSLARFQAHHIGLAAVGWSRRSTSAMAREARDRNPATRAFPPSLPAFRLGWIRAGPEQEHAQQLALLREADPAARPFLRARGRRHAG